jgi:SAM-dependent methyltransferase
MAGVVRWNSSDDGAARFSDRVADYVRYRPSYPDQLVRDLVAAGRLSSGQTVADIGSGTGLLSRLFLDAGCRVFGVEPNREMRLAGESELAGSVRFTSVDGTAEATTLPSASVRCVVAGQAFHWFDHDLARLEFNRILVPGGVVALVWNDREYDSTPFLRGYEALLVEFGTDYREVNHRNLQAGVFDRFFGVGRYEERSYPNQQRLDYPGIEGRLLSSSYTPAPGHPERAAMLARLRKLFKETEDGGQVEILYRTRVWVGTPGP